MNYSDLHIGPCRNLTNESTRLERILYVYTLGPLIVLGFSTALLFWLLTYLASPIPSRSRGASSKRSTIAKHFYVYIYACILWDILACINFTFFPFLYYYNHKFGIFNKSLFTYTTRVTFYIEQLCAGNVNWITTFMSLDRLIALYAPHRYAVTMNQARVRGRFRFWTLSCTIVTLHLFIIALLSIPYVLYVDVNRARMCNPYDIVVYFYYFSMSSFNNWFAPKFDKAFGILIYLMPTVLIFISNIAILIGLYRRRTKGLPREDISSCRVTNTNHVISTYVPTLSSHVRNNQVHPEQSSKLFLQSNSKLSPGSQISSLPSQLNRRKAAESLNNYLLTIGISAEFLILNIPYVVYVCLSSTAWASTSGGPLAKAQTVVNLLKYSNHTFNIIASIVFNQEYRAIIKKLLK